AFLWLFLPFSLEGKTLFHVWRLKLTIEGIRFAFLITLKCNAILMIIITFIATIPMPTVGYALSSLGFSERLTLILLMSYRYIDVIFEEYKRLAQSLKVRCFKPGTNLHTYRTYAYLIAMVFARSYERGIRVYQAMLLRGFNGRFYSLRRFKLKNSDILLFIGILLSDACLIILDRGMFI
ncbi:MAG: cobalt ECF transporter T component CbiQ, partial [Deltaproteobacteria bacterium]